jgi:hypothetical protein
MTPEANSPAAPFQLLRLREGLVVHQVLYAAAKLGVADLLNDGPRTTIDLAAQLEVNESALRRVLRALASKGVFEETSPRSFANNAASSYLRTGVPGSMRSMMIFGGTESFYRPFGEILYSIQTGQSARSKVLGMDSWEFMQQNPAAARIFDDAMTDFSALVGPAIASAYDFGQWGNIMDVGGGNGVLLAAILKAHAGLTGILADLPHVLERAGERGFLGGELRFRSSMLPCDFLYEVSSGCRAYVMKSVIHDWDDEHAHTILVNCRRAVPADGALQLVECALPEANVPSASKLLDVVMLIMTGGRERSIEEYGQLLANAGFRLNRVVPTTTDFIVVEALPA